ncbi:MAG: hypothetical protein EXR53_05935 [Dehalococcoidia bacterium]|nr:hypothetical protein [Dehalococcoidia bacterium]
MESTQQPHGQSSGEWATKHVLAKEVRAVFSLKSTDYITRLGGLAATLGGLMFVIKGGGIIITGIQPPVVFEIAPPFFAIGLIGLYAQVKERSKRLSKAGFFLAAVACIAWVAAIPYGLFSENGFSSSEEFASPQSLLILGGCLTTLCGLVLLGVASLRAGILPPRWRALPLAMGVLALPLMGLGGALEPLWERYFEIPIVVLGFAWIALGYLVWRSVGMKAQRPQLGT